MQPDTGKDRRPATRERLAAFIHHPVTDMAVMGLILVSVVLLIWEASAAGDTTLYHRLDMANYVLTMLFVVELAIRFHVERRKSRFFRNYWLDILAVLPIFRPLRFLRFLRLLRVFRLGVLLHRRFSVMSAAFRHGFGEQILVVGFLVVIVIASAMVLTLIGEKSPDGRPLFQDFGHAFKWSLLSLVAGEPIGETPRTVGGILVVLTVMLGGITLFATFTGVITAIIVNRLKGGLERFEMDLEELSHHTLVCGFNRACALILEELQTDPDLRRRGIVLVTEQDVRERLEDRDIDLSCVHFIRGDWTHSDVLTRAGAERAAIAVVLSDRTRDLSDQDRDARTLLAALTLERMNPAIFTCAELLNSENEANLKLAGIDEVIARDQYTGSMIAAGARSLGIVAVLKELLTSKWGNQFYKIDVPEHWVGREVREVRRELQDDHEAILVALETSVEGRHSGAMNVNPGASTVLEAGQLLVVIADRQPRIGSTLARGLWSEANRAKKPGDTGQA